MRFKTLPILIAACFLSVAELHSQWPYTVSADGHTDNPFQKINTQKADDFTGLEQLQPFVSGPRVFISGENHRHVAVNGLIEFKLLRFLHEKAGVQHLLLELGEARGWYANRYVNEPDTLERYCLMATTSVEHMKILDDIREWNLTLPAEKRIQIHGIDVERFNDIALLRLSDLLPKTKVPENLYTAVHAVHQAAGWLKHSGVKEFESAQKSEYYQGSSQPFSIDRSIDLILEHFDSLDVELKNWTGSRYADVQSGINSLREYKQWNEYRSSAFYYTWREENMFRKLTRLLNSDTSARFFGQFGRCHTAYVKQDGDCGWYAYQSLAHRLQERYFHTKGGTLSIGIFYDEERNNNTGNTEAEIDDAALQKEISRLLQFAPAESVSIARLDEKQNPILASRFSFFIAVREFRLKIQKPGPSKDKFGFTVGLNTLFLNNAAELANHINPALATGQYRQLPFVLGLNWNNPQFTAGLQMGSTISEELYARKDEISIRYLFQFAGAYAGWRFMTTKKLSMDLGPQIFHATQTIRCRRYTGGFLNPDMAYLKTANNHALGVGIQVRLHYKILKHASAGLAAGYLRDVSAPDWFIAKTNLYYARNLLQTQVTGSSLSVFFNFDL